MLNLTYVQAGEAEGAYAVCVTKGPRRPHPPSQPPVVYSELQEKVRMVFATTTHTHTHLNFLLHCMYLPSLPQLQFWWWLFNFTHVSLTPLTALSHGSSIHITYGLLSSPSRLTQIWPMLSWGLVPPPSLTVPPARKRSQCIPRLSHNPTNLPSQPQIPVHSLIPSLHLWQVSSLGPMPALLKTCECTVTGDRSSLWTN